MPVPSSSLPCDLTSMETTAGITLLTSCGMVTLPLSTAAPGVAPLSSTVRPLFEVVGVVGEGGDPGTDQAADQCGDEGDREPDP